MHRFRILWQGEVIATSALELGDPPMGGAGGKCAVTARGQDVLATLPPEPDGDPDILRRVGFQVETPDGEQIPALDVVLFSVLGEVDVEVTGIPHPLYEALFPERTAAYWGADH